MTEETFSWVLKKGDILLSLREAMIFIITKEGKKLQHSGYRPLTVLNKIVDY